MRYGIATGIVWALETVLFALILSKSTFTESTFRIFLAPFVAAFINDFFSNLWLLLFRKTQRRYKRASVVKVLKSRKGRLLILSGLFGGPLGMSAYLLSIKYVGASYAAAFSALFPVIGSVIGWVFFREKLSKLQGIGVLICTIGVLGMSGVTQGSPSNPIYLLFALSCALFWGLEGVIASYAMREGDISYEIALQIRHITSIISYGVLFLPLLRAWDFTIIVFTDLRILPLLLFTALLETASYLLYYKAFSVIGAPKAMSLNVTYIMWSIVFGAVIFQVYPKIHEIISALVLMIGVILVALFEGKRDKRDMNKINAPYASKEGSEII